MPTKLFNLKNGDRFLYGGYLYEVVNKGLWKTQVQAVEFDEHCYTFNNNKKVEVYEENN